MAGLTGLEPATSSVTGWHSNRLSYNPSAILRKLFLFLGYDVYSFFQSFTRFELGNSCSRNINLLAGLRILTLAGSALGSGECTETDKTEFVTVFQSSSYTADEGRNSFFSFYFFQASLFCY